MDEEERQKKLQAGKERLAAFQRKKTRKKKKKTDCGDTASESSFGEVSLTSSLSYEESLEGSSADEMASLERDETADRTTELRKAVDRITELEETLHGKQAALDSLIQENDQLKSKMETENAPSVEEYVTKIEGFQQAVAARDQALVQRDEVIRQLSERLQQDSAGQTAETSQTQQLSQQVQALHQQLEQADILLRKQTTEYDLCAQTLQRARDEILSLKQTVQGKDVTLEKLAHKNSELAEQIHGLRNDNKTLSEREKESTDVVRKLMSDVEALQKSGNKRSYVPPSSSNHVVDAEAQLAALRAELEEVHGEQIVMIKQQMEEMKRQAVEQLQRENQVLTKQVKDWENWYVQIQEQLHHMQQLATRVEALSAQNHALQVELENLRSRDSGAVDLNKVEELQAENDRLLKDLRESEIARNSLTQTVNKLKSQIEEPVPSRTSDNIEIERIRDENRQLALRLKESEEGKETFVSKVSDLESQLEKIKSEKSVKTNSEHLINSDQIENNVRNVAVQGMVNDVGNFDAVVAEQNRLSAQLKQSEKLNEQLHKRVDELKIRLGELRTHYENEAIEKETMLKTEFDEQRLQWEMENERNMSSLRTQLSELKNQHEKELDKKEAELHESLTLNSHLKNRVNELNSRLEQENGAESQHVLDVQRIDKLLEERDHLNAQVRHANLVNSKLSVSVEEYKAQVDDMTNRCQTVDDDLIKELQNNNSALETQLELKTNENEELKKSLEMLESEKDALKSDLWQCNAEIGRLNSVIESLNAQLGVETAGEPSSAEFFPSPLMSPVEKRKPGFPPLDASESADQNQLMGSHVQEKALENEEENDMAELQHNLVEAERNLEELTEDETDDEDETVSELHRHYRWEIANLKEHYEETMAFELRTQKLNLTDEYESKMAKFKEQKELELSSKLQAAKLENEQRFVEEMRKVKADLNKKSEVIVGELQAQNEELTLARDVLLQDRSVTEDSMLCAGDELVGESASVDSLISGYTVSDPLSTPRDLGYVSPDKVAVCSILEGKHADISHSNLSHEDAVNENKNLKKQVAALLGQTVDVSKFDQILGENKMLKEQLASYQNENILTSKLTWQDSGGHTYPYLQNTGTTLHSIRSDDASSDDLIQEILSLRSQLERQQSQTGAENSLVVTDVGCKDHLQTVKEDNARLEDEKSQVAMKLELSQRMCKDLEAKNTSLQNEMEELKLTMSLAENEDNALNVENDFLKTRLSEERDEKSLVGNRLDASLSKCGNLELKVKALEEQLHSSHMEKSTFQQERDAATQEVESLKQLISTLKDEKQLIEREFAKLKKKFAKDAEDHAVLPLHLPLKKELSPPKSVLSPVIEETNASLSPVIEEINTSLEDGAEALAKNEVDDLDVSQVSSVSSVSTLPSPSSLDLVDAQNGIEQDLKNEVMKLTVALDQQKEDFQAKFIDLEKRLQVENTKKNEMDLELEVLRCKCKELESEKQKAISSFVETQKELELTQEQYKLDVSQLDSELKNVEVHSTPKQEKSNLSITDLEVTEVPPGVYSEGFDVSLSGSGKTSPLVMCEKLEFLEKSNVELVKENKVLNLRLSQQERIVNELRERVDHCDFSSSDSQRALYTEQLSMLRTQRDQLFQRLEVQLDKERTMSDMLGQHSMLEENLRREKHLLASKLREKEAIEVQLLAERTALEKSIREQQQLESSLLQKDQIEVELTKQKRLLENELDEIESRLVERELQLEHEKELLSEELKTKDMVIQRLESVCKQSNEKKTVAFSVETKTGSDQGRSEVKPSSRKCKAVKSTRRDVDREHADAIERLRHELSVKFESTESSRKYHSSWLSL